MQIYISNKQKDLSITSVSIKKLVLALVKKLKIRCDEISIHFVTTKKIVQLHDEFFSDPTTTDCITFPQDNSQQEGYIVLGEVFVCPKTAIDFSEKHGKDVYEETSLYLVHGILHLLGYDDIDPKDRIKMRKKERYCMSFLKENNLALKNSCHKPHS